jgi:hypothetical protein
MALEPSVVPPRRVRQRHDERSVPILRSRHNRTPVRDRLGQCSSIERSEMPGLCVESDNQKKVKVRHRHEEVVPPRWRTFAARRKISAFGIQSGKAKPHRNERYPSRVIEGIGIDPEPVPQPIARRIREGPTGRVNTRSRRLASDANPRGRRDLQDRSRLMRQGRPRGLIATDTACADRRHQ